MNILFTICGRAGSKGFKNKNLKKMNDIPLVYYSLAAIKAYIDAHTEDYVMIAINTDSIDLIGIIKKQDLLKNIIFVERKEEFAGDKAPKVSVIKDTYLTVCKDEPFDVIVDLDITSPMRTLSDIENIVNEFFSKEYDIVFSVVKARRSPYFNMVELKEDGFYRKICKSSYTARQQAPYSYEMNASIYAYSPKFLQSKIENTILDYNCGIVEMKDYLVLDIDSEEDFVMMSSLFTYFLKKYDGLKDVYNLAMMLNGGE